MCIYTHAHTYIIEIKTSAILNIAKCVESDLNFVKKKKKFSNNEVGALQLGVRKNYNSVRETDLFQL